MTITAPTSASFPFPAAPDALLDQGMNRAAPTLRTGSAEDVAQSAKEFEEFFIFHVVQSMHAGLDAEAPFGGGSSERTFRSFMFEAYAEQISASGGLGIADQVKGELIRMQIAEQNAAQGERNGA